MIRWSGIPNIGWARATTGASNIGMLRRPFAVTTKYDKSAKAPDALLRLGQSLAALNQKEAACASYGEVLQKYPRASAGVKAAVERGQKKKSADAAGRFCAEPKVLSAFVPSRHGLRDDIDGRQRRSRPFALHIDAVARVALSVMEVSGRTDLLPAASRDVRPDRDCDVKEHTARGRLGLLDPWADRRNAAQIGVAGSNINPVRSRTDPRFNFL